MSAPVTERTDRFPILTWVVLAFTILVIISGYLGCAGSYYWTLAYMWARGLSPAGEDATLESVSDTPDLPRAPDPTA